VIAAPKAVVFAAAADIRNAPQMIPEILKVEMLTDGPIGVGSKFKETRKMFGREATETMEFTVFQPNDRYVLSCHSCGALIETEFRFSDNVGGTLVEVTMTGRAQTFFAKLMTPLSWLMSGMMKKCLQGDLDRIKASIEQSPQPV
jgi:hypothetical protein